MCSLDQLSNFLLGMARPQKRNWKNLTFSWRMGIVPLWYSWLKAIISRPLDWNESIGPVRSIVTDLSGVLLHGISLSDLSGVLLQKCEIVQGWGHWCALLLEEVDLCGQDMMLARLQSVGIYFYCILPQIVTRNVWMSSMGLICLRQRTDRPAGWCTSLLPT